jgi:hypothetical protein
MSFRIAREQTFGIPKAPKKRPKVDPDARKLKDHLHIVHALPCVVCGSRERIEAAHLRMADIERGKDYTAKGKKPSDKWITPLCARHHREGPDAQHNGSERAFWERHGIDPITLCQRLWEATGDLEAMMFVIRTARQYRETGETV